MFLTASGKNRNEIHASFINFSYLKLCIPSNPRNTFTFSISQNSMRTINILFLKMCFNMSEFQENSKLLDQL